MKSLRQVLRQPLKSAAGILMAAAAAAILVICAGQYAAAGLTRANLDDRYDTLAVRNAGFGNDSFDPFNFSLESELEHSELLEGASSWIADTVRSRPDLVKTESYTGLLSAYAPGLSPDNFSHHFLNLEGDVGGWVGEIDELAYRGAMLEVTLTRVGTGLWKDESYFSFTDENGEWRNQTVTYRTSMVCEGTVEAVIGLERGFSPPAGKTIALAVTAYSEKELAALDLRAGERYLVYGMDYSDVRGSLFRGFLSKYPDLEELYSGLITYETLYSRGDPSAVPIDCYMTVCDYSALPVNTASDGEVRTLTDQRQFYTRDADGAHYTLIPAEKYIPDYRVPTIVRLDGSAESFLSSEDGALWRSTLEEMEIGQHGFPVLAVDKLGYQVVFARGQARVTEGRDFSESERAGGSRVCIVSEALAAANGLKVGDAVELRTYGMDPNLRPQPSLTIGYPGAAVYSRAMGFSSEMESYTVVGLYRLDNAWLRDLDGDIYGITPNVIFVPKASATGEMLTEDTSVFYSLVLQNGKADEFKKYQAEAGYPDLFVLMDGGYEEIAAGLDAFEGVSAGALAIGILGSAAVVLLFLILFPFQQGKALATMRSLGASRGRRIGHVMVSSASLLLPGAALGALAGALLWERVAAKLMASVNVQIPLEANMAVLAPSLAAGLCAAAGALALLAALLLSGGEGLGRGK